jgi:glucosyl-dolichyl phosphate glucuronosyltransferase
MMISICLCTYNRAHLLQYCLEALIGIEASCRIEIIVVDNNSSDNTEAVVKTFASISPHPISYYFEPIQGLSVARNRAIEESRGDILAFLDDECIVPPNWIQLAVTTIKSFKPNILGGPYTGTFVPGQSHSWYKKEYGNAYFLNYNLAKGFQDAFYASGGNMFINKIVFDNFKFNTSLGMKGGKLGLGEEGELQQNYLNAHPNERIYYDPDLVVQHMIVPQKMTLIYRAKRLFAIGRGMPVTSSRRLFADIGNGILVVTLAFPRCLLRSRKKYPHWKNYIFENVLPPIAILLGILFNFACGPNR